MPISAQTQLHPGMIPAPSYLSGGAHPPLVYATIGSILRQTACDHPEGEALIVAHQNVRWSWRQLDERVDRLATSLIRLGLHAGDRLAIWSANCAEWVVVQLATARIGVILVTINPAYRIFELQHALQLTQCRAMVLADQFKSCDYVAMLLQIAPHFGTGQAAIVDSTTGLQLAIFLGENPPGALLAFGNLLDCTANQEALAARAATLQPEDPINIQFTSGTSGAPKGATLTHHNILNNASAVGAAMGIGPADRICIPVPLYHCFGMVMGVLNCVIHGATMVFPGASFEPAAVLEAVAAERCTALYGVPAMFIAELAHADFKEFDLSCLRTGIMAGAPCPTEIMQRVITDMGMGDITICYGMTETSPVSFQTRATSSLDARVNTVGVIGPHLEAKLVDCDGHVVPLGEMGEILVRGYSVMPGYWGDAARTAEAIDPRGWMHTGDLGCFDREGNCRVVGRSKDMIIRGGENIYPAEVENFLFGHPDIIEAAVFGIPDDRMGECVCAWIRTSASLTEQDVIDFCRGNIARFKIPTIIRFVDSFPMTVTGKIQKFVMRDAMADERGQPPDA